MLDVHLFNGAATSKPVVEDEIDYHVADSAPVAKKPAVKKEKPAPVVEAADDDSSLDADIDDLLDGIDL